MFHAEPLRGPVTGPLVGSINAGVDGGVHFAQALGSAEDDARSSVSWPTIPVWIGVYLLGTLGR